MSDFDNALADARRLHRSGQVDQATAVYRSLLEQAPLHADANYLLGAAHLQRGDFENALACFQRALDTNPHHGDALFNRGNALRELQHFDAAIDSYDRAIAIRPDDAAAHSNRGVALQAVERHNDALKSLQLAVSIDPSNANAHYHLGNVQQDLGDLAAAVTSYQRALELNPRFPFLAGTLHHLRMRICDWDQFDTRLDGLIEDVARGEKVSPVLPLLALTDAPEVHLRAAAIWGKVRTEHVEAPNATLALPSMGKLRIGYFSADFHEHPTSFLMAAMFEAHDKSRFEITAFSWGPSSQSPMRARLVKAFDRFEDIGSLSDAQVARRSRELGIDIAIDLKGYTGQSRPAIFAHRAAPIQASYLGFPGSMALPCIDYLIADRIVVPPESRRFYQEALAYLPDSYQVNDSTRPSELNIPTRAEHGLPEAVFVFCGFNNNYKILPETFAGWMRVLALVPDSILWLFEDNALARCNLLQHAARCGIEPGRLIFAKRVPLLEHLERQQLADLFLDTYPYNAHTTASDALWVGLPVLTRCGRSFASRVAASLLSAVGLDQLITTSQSAFEKLAVELAFDKTRLATIRSSLKADGRRSTLFNAALFTRHFEEMLVKMHERRSRGLADADLDLSEQGHRLES